MFLGVYGEMIEKSKRQQLKQLKRREKCTAKPLQAPSPEQCIKNMVGVGNPDN